MPHRRQTRAPSSYEVAIGPVGHSLKFGKQLFHRFGRVRQRLDTVAQRLVKHLSTALVADLAKEDVGDVALGYRIASVKGLSAVERGDLLSQG